MAGPSALRAMLSAAGNSTGSYLSPGMMFTAGFSVPGEGVYHKPGESIWQFGNMGIRKGPGVMPDIMTDAQLSATKVHGGKTMQQALAPGRATQWLQRRGKAGAMLGKAAPFTVPGLAVGMSGYFMYKGYKGEMGARSGVAGAWDAGIMDLSVSSAIMRFGAKTTAAGAGVMMTRAPGLLRIAGVGMLGAFPGASVGQALAGTPGALIGGYAGGALASAAIAHPIIAAGAAATVGGAYIVGKGAYSLMKTGYRKKQYQKRIDTAGDMNAFMTQGAITMRQRSIDAMRRSGIPARQAMGMESTFAHSSRNYFSTYRQF